jgi:hypothetical protein
MALWQAVSPTGYGPNFRLTLVSFSFSYSRESVHRVWFISLLLMEFD